MSIPLSVEETFHKHNGFDVVSVTSSNQLPASRTYGRIVMQRSRQYPPQHDCILCEWT